jgi:hypothetical protein
LHKKIINNIKVRTARPNHNKRYLLNAKVSTINITVAIIEKIKITRETVLPVSVFLIFLLQS